MPPVVAAIGAVVGAVGAAATAIVGAVGLAGVASALGLSAFGLITTVATVGYSLLKGGPKQPPVSQENRNRLRANVDVRTPRKTTFGTTAMATDIRDEEFTGANQDYFHRFIVVASHKVNAITSIYFDDKIAWTAAGGVQGEFVDYLEVATVLEGNSGNAINISARMGSTRRYTGLAYVHLKYKLTGNTNKVDSPFAQSVTTRITIIGNGAYVYDPRLDSTVAGGSGSHRADDQTTWAWDASACNNPALALLFYLLGWEIGGKLAVGKGIPKERIDLESFAIAANICDESVTKTGGGTEARYRVAGVWSEGDSPTTVIDMLKASMNADLDDVDGKLRLTIFKDDGFTSDADFTEEDLIGPFEWQQSRPLDQTFNVVRGVYTDASTTALYQQVDYPQQSTTSPDGIDRIATLDLPMVESVGQAQRLAQLRLTRETYSGTFKADFQATAWRVQKNSIVRLTFPHAGPSGGFVNKTFRVAEMEMRVDGVVPLTLVEEDPDIYVAPALVYGVDGTDSTPHDPLLDPVIAALLNFEELEFNFNNRNDRLADAIVDPTIVTDGTAVDHTINGDGSSDMSFEWQWSGDEADIDGFEVMLYSSASASAYTPGTTPAAETVILVPPYKRAMIVTGVPTTAYYTWAVRAYRVVDADIDAGQRMESAWVKPSLAAENPYRPASSIAFTGNITGTINGTGASTVSTATANFNSRNDRDNSTPTAPTISGAGTAVDHIINSGDGSASISFEWSWGGTEANIDGFDVLVYASSSASSYTPGTDAAGEVVHTVVPSRRAFGIHGVDPTYYYTFAVRPFRIVDPDVNAAGRVTGAWVKPSLAAEDPYRPSANAAFPGNLSGTIDGVAVATVVTNAADGAAAATTVNNGLNSDGTVKATRVGTTAFVSNAAAALGAATTSTGTAGGGMGSYIDVSGASVTITPDSTTSVFQVISNFTLVNGGVSDTTAYMANVPATGNPFQYVPMQASGGLDSNSSTIVTTVTGLSGSTTFKLRMQAETFVDCLSGATISVLEVKKAG